jgi:hypothetical protein
VRWSAALLIAVLLGLAVPTAAEAAGCKAPASALYQDPLTYAVIVVAPSVHSASWAGYTGQGFTRLRTYAFDNARIVRAGDSLTVTGHTDLATLVVRLNLRTGAASGALVEHTGSGRQRHRASYLFWVPRGADKCA